MDNTMSENIKWLGNIYINDGFSIVTKKFEDKLLPNVE